jgi:hypothetical protein
MEINISTNRRQTEKYVDKLSAKRKTSNHFTDSKFTDKPVPICRVYLFPCPADKDLYGAILPSKEYCAENYNHHLLC